MKSIAAAKRIFIAITILALVTGCTWNIGAEMNKGASETEEKNAQAVAHHLESRLKDARELYAEVLKLDPPRQPTIKE